MVMPPNYIRFIADIGQLILNWGDFGSNTRIEKSKQNKMKNP